MEGIAVVSTITQGLFHLQLGRVLLVELNNKGQIQVFEKENKMYIVTIKKHTLRNYLRALIGRPMEPVGVLRVDNTGEGRQEIAKALEAFLRSGFMITVHRKGDRMAKVAV